MSIEMEMMRRLAGLEAEVGRLKTMETPHLNSGINDFLLLPGLVGFWPMSSVQRSTGNVYDLSNQGRMLTYNGNPTYNVYDLTPYIDLDGTGDYLSRADETDLDIQGTETIFASAVRGLTLGGWFWFDNAPGASSEICMSKFSASAGNYSYFVRRLPSAQGGFANFLISDNGSVLTEVSGTSIPTAGSWWWIVGRFDPGVELAVWLNGSKWTNTTSIPASIYNGNAAFVIGGRDGGTLLLDGRASLCFLCAAALKDNLINYLYRRSRALFI